MDPQELVEQLLALPDAETQKRFLAEHAPALDERFAGLLKDRATQLLGSDIQRSLHIADLLYSLAERNAAPPIRALGLLAEANARAIGLGEYKPAIALFDQAAQIYHEQGRPVDEARSQVGKLWALSNLGRYAEALAAGQWASQVLEEHSEWQILAGLTMNMAIVHNRSGDDARALEMFDRAGELYRRLQAETQWLHVQLNRAIVLCNLGRFDEAVRASLTAHEGLERLGQKVPAARARQGLALTYFVQGRYNEALAHLDQVRDVFLADGRRRDAMLVELFVSDCLLRLRRFGDVLDKCQQVRRLFSELGMQHAVAQAIVDEAVAYTELGRYAEALDSLAEARQMFAEEGNRAKVASTDLETATVLARQGRHVESLALAQECAAVLQACDLPVEHAHAELVAAQAALALGDQDLALRLATAALEVGETRNVPLLKYKGYQLLGVLAVRRGDAPGALEAYERAIGEVERLRGRLMVEFRAGFVEDKEVIYEDAVALCLDLGQPSRGLGYAERAKSHALLDLLAYRLDLGVQARTAADRPLVEEMVQLRARRDQLYRRWEGEAGAGERGWVTRSGERGQAQQEVLALEKRITELWHRLLIRNADYAREAALWNVRTESVQPYLGADSVLLEYFVVHGSLVAFLVTAQGVQAFRLPGDLARVRNSIQSLGFNLTLAAMCPPGQGTGLTASAQKILQQLYQLLVAPLRDELSTHSEWIIVPHGFLHYLPFHALYDGQRYLLEQHEISYLPGSSILRYCQEYHPDSSGLLAVGNSCGGRLPYALQEVEQIVQIMGGQLLREEQSTLAAFCAAASGCRTIHLASHGEFRADNPLFSSLTLADGWLTTLDIFNMHLNASLVTLSGCQTGRSVVGGGDELLGLMRAFLHAGAAAVVLSLWAVEDCSTAELMETFYRKLASGWTKGEALRHAQLCFAQGPAAPDAPDRRHPYFWAPFFLVGNAGPL